MRGWARSTSSACSTYTIPLSRRHVKLLRQRPVRSEGDVNGMLTTFDLEITEEINRGAPPIVRQDLSL